MNEAVLAILVGGGSMGLLGFIVAIVKVFQQDRVWRDIITALREDRDALRDELQNCASERGELRGVVETLRGEVIALRREVHRDDWLGINARRIPLPAETPPT